MTEASRELTQLSVEKSPGPYLGEPDNFTQVPRELVAKEVAGVQALAAGDKKRSSSVWASEFCAQNRRPSFEYQVSQLQSPRNWWADMERC